jgi:COX assembly mitochondrial protein 2
LLTGCFVGCEEVMQALEECHAKGFLHGVFGGCNQAKREVNTCLRAARLERTARNREQAKERTARKRELFKEIDENS